MHDLTQLIEKHLELIFYRVDVVVFVVGRTVLGELFKFECEGVLLGFLLCELHSQHVYVGIRRLCLELLKLFGNSVSQSPNRSFQKLNLVLNTRQPIFLSIDWVFVLVRLKLFDRSVELEDLLSQRELSFVFEVRGDSRREVSLAGAGATQWSTTGGVVRLVPQGVSWRS